MITLADIHREADESDVEIAYTFCPNSGSISIMSDSGNCYIGIDNSINDNSEELVRTAHELGHCKTGAFYNRDSPFNVIEKLEYKADKWATFQLIPPLVLRRAIEQGFTEVWQLAEYFGVTEEFIRRAIYIYKHSA